MNIRRLLTAAVLATGIAAFAGPAFAGPIIGSIDVSGGPATITTSGGVTTITFSNSKSANIFSVSGSFDELGTCSACVSLGTPFASNQTFSSTPPFALFTGDNNKDTVVLDVTSANFSALDDGGYQVTGMGNVVLSGYTTTMGSYSMTIPSSGTGASVDIYTSVPEPGTLALFGAGLLGFAVFVGRRRRATKPLA